MSNHSKITVGLSEFITNSPDRYAALEKADAAH
jgi:hypothetical protein